MITKRLPETAYERLRTPHLRPADQITNMTWQPEGDRKAQGQALAKQYGIRTGQITHCFVCHR